MGSHHSLEAELFVALVAFFADEKPERNVLHVLGFRGPACTCLQGLIEELRLRVTDRGLLVAADLGTQPLIEPSPVADPARLVQIPEDLAVVLPV